jgi:hypothetical protein
MKRAALSLSAAVPLLIAAAAPQPAAAQTIVPLPSFAAVELNGGGKVRLRHGPVQRVTILRGDPRVSRIEVERQDRGRNGTLVIDACRRSCRNYSLEVEIVTPSIAAIAVRGGGRIDALGAFPARGELGVAVGGGGVIDARALPARNVGAAVNGGGRILTRASASLGAAISGGGQIVYWGNPAISTAINGGGVVTRGK